MSDVVVSDERYQLHVMLLDVSPAPWRRLLIRPETTIDELHRLIQRCMAWDERAWHAFRIHGTVQFGRRSGYGGSDPDGTADTALLHFRLIPGERFCYDYGDWRCQLRLERIVVVPRPRVWPVCMGGKWGAPPEQSGGGFCYMNCRQRMILAQARDYEDMALTCPECATPRSVKGASAIILRTLFGALTIPCRRLYHCRCEGSGRSSFSPIAALFPERSTPELIFLQTKWASLMSYGLTCDLLADVLPLDHRLSPRSVRRQLHRVAERLEDDLGEEVSMIGGLQTAIPDLDAVLDAQGLTQRQSIRFVSDGGDTVRNLQQHLHGEGEHWLDWFHITMRITVMRQMAKSITSAEVNDLPARVDRDLARMKWLLWHGNHVDGADAADLITWDLELADNQDAAAKLDKALGEFSGYIRKNADFIANYGDKWRNGERISSGFTESTINQVLSRRMVKKQQMRWTKRSAHLLLQTRTQTLNGDLRKCFQRWHPEMKAAA
jgi:Plasmid pRiA4b ORF-3-like protein